MKLVNTQYTTIPALQDGTTSVTSNGAKAELLDSFFYEYVNHLFPPLGDPVPLDPETCPASILCTEEEVLDLLCTFDSTKLTGLDGVSAVMLLLFQLHPVS